MDTEPIAIVGFGAVFPGPDGPDGFWRVVVEGRSTACEVPEGRWVLPRELARDPAIARPDRVYSTRGCFVDDFRLEREELAALDLDAGLVADLDPSIHLALRAGLRAWKDARLDALGLERRRRTAVILGNIALPTERSSALAEEVFLRSRERNPVHPLNRYAAGLPGGLLARALGLGGGAFTLDAACASSLYAVKIACDELAARRADVVLAGGLSRPDCLYTQMGFSQLRALSPTGRCSPFDASADGLVVGEGAGIVVLKRLEDALRDGDRVDAVIRGIGLSNDVGGSLMSPDSEGQLRAMREAYRRAGWAPDDVDLIECHGTGTPVGDAVELASLASLWADASDAAQAKRAKQRCVLGSVKSNVGHLLTAAGAAGLIKALLALRHRTFPPTASFQSPAAGLATDDSPFEVLSSPRAWPRRDASIPRRAAVSAFGFGGINAHVLLEELDASAARPLPRRAPLRGVAVVGMDACFGSWRSLRAFQERVLGGGEVDEARVGGHPLKSFELEVDRFRVPPRELRETLPQQILMLQVAARAIDDARLKVASGIATGVFIGIELDLNTTNFHLRWSAPQAERDRVHPPLTPDRTMGALGGIVASRVARHLRAGGPSFTVSSEETSGLKALELAAHALEAGEVDLAIAGAVDLASDARSIHGAHALRPFSPSGVARPFDEAANGTVAGEGAAAVVLKRLEDAERDGDRIYAVIRGIGSASGGGVGAEKLSPDAYGAALERAYTDAGVDAATIGLVECHGSGHRGEDAAEASALRQRFGGSTRGNDVRHCAMSSAKADIGHAGAAAGMASLVKACLCLYHEVLPPLRGTSRLIDPIGASEDRLFVPLGPQYWLRNRADGPRRAGVSAMGIDGTAAHVVLEAREPVNGDARVELERRRPLGAFREAIFAVEAEDAAGLVDGLERLRAFAMEGSRSGIEILARKWLEARGTHPGRRIAAALVARDALGLASGAEAGLRAVVDRSSTRSIQRGFHYNPSPSGAPGSVAFVFPGSGSQFAGMGRDVSAAWPELLRRQDSESLHLASQMARGRLWNRQTIESFASDHRTLIFAQVSTGTLLSDVVQSFGVRPDAVIGHSLGESAGLFATRTWRDRDEMLRRMEASALFTEELAGSCRAARRAWGIGDHDGLEWKVGVVDSAAEAVRDALRGKDRVYLLIVNTPGECVIGGERDAVDAVVRSLRCGFVPLQGITTVHCEVARQVEEAYRELHLFETVPPEGVRFYSGAWGRAYELTRDSAADSIAAQAIATLDFTRVIESAYADGLRVFLEMGPGSSATRMIGRILEGRPHAAFSTCPADQEGTSALFRFLAQCIAERVPVDLNQLYGRESLAVGLRESERERERRTLTIDTSGLTLRDLPPRAAQPAPKPAVRPRSPDAVRLSPPPANPRRQRARSSGVDVARELAEVGLTTAAAHEAFLRASASFHATAMRALRLKAEFLRSAGDIQPDTDGEALTLTMTAEAAAPAVFLDRDGCLELAVGSIGKALGPAFAAIDAHPTRVRLPAEPLMLVDRIVEVEGEPLSMTSGRVVTEHNVEKGAWYLDCGRIPVSIAVEAGQADLFLSGYLGIDFETKGLAVYRLLDAVVTFHRELPGPGSTIRYDIRIDRFFRQGETRLFRFRFEATVDGEPLLSMRDGCAGFFTSAELAAGKGIVHTTLDLRPAVGLRPADWRELAAMTVESCSSTQLDALRAGDLAVCFGQQFAALGLRKPVTIPSGRMRLVDRVERIEPAGGRYGLGLIRGEADIRPGDWFLACHFSDDRVMPGTLMYECCLHTLRIFLLRLGWIGEEGRVAYEPTPGASSRLKCRGQVTETTRTVTYEVALKELGYGPEPYAIADALVYADGKPIVEMAGMSVRLSGLTREELEAMWRRGRSQPGSTEVSARAPKRSLFDRDRILAFAVGKPSEAFGERYRVFDSARVIARLPGPPYQFLDRITRIDGCEPWRMAAGGEIEAEYDVPAAAWYFESNRSREIPFAVLLEVALQPCGWLAAYLGSALTSPGDLSFRNLGGSAVQLLKVTRASGALTTRVKITRVSSSGGMIIQNYDFEVRSREGIVYRGETYFGFFSKEALAQQVGIRDVVRYEPSADEAVRSVSFAFPAEAPFPDERLRMVDTVDLWSRDGGPSGLGFIRGSKTVRPTEWFFAAHFHQDPVWPGSLGLEAFLQILKVVAVRRWRSGNPARGDAFDSPCLGAKHEWIYRGQVLPTSRHVTVEAAITEADDRERMLRADGLLLADGRAIYQMKGFTLRMPGRSPCATPTCSSSPSATSSRPSW